MLLKLIKRLFFEKAAHIFHGQRCGVWIIVAKFVSVKTTAAISIPHILVPADKAVGVIPARWGSSRFPGKPLALIAGKPMIQWVWERASSVLQRVVVATDDRRIADTAIGFGADVVMTTPECANGTARCFQACRALSVKGVSVIDIQGDEPLLDVDLLRAVTTESVRRPDSIVTAVRRCCPDESALIHSPDTVKAILDADMNARWFSRAPIPWMRDVPTGRWASRLLHFFHIGIYAFGSDVIEKVEECSDSDAGEAESLEQLNWIECGVPIHCIETRHRQISVDTPQDLAVVQKLVSQP